MVFRGFAEIPAAQVESSALLGLSALSKWRYVAWPAIMPTILYFAGMTFLLSLGSFGSLSILGGGPSSQTLEMAIFQTIFYDENWRGAAIFATTHTLLAGAASALFVIPQYRWLNAYLSDHVKENTSETRLLQFIRIPFWAKACSLFASMALDLLIAIPVIAIFSDAAAWSFSTGATADLAAPLLLKSAQTSITYAIPAAIISTVCAFLVARAFCRYKDSHHPTLATAILSTSLASAIVPAMAAAFGILVIRSAFDTIQLGTYAIIGLHSTLILPFLISVILPRYGRAVSPFEQTRILNGVPGLKWAATVEWRIVGKTLAIALAIALALSMNETAIVSMLGDPTSPALTTAMIQLMGHYHFGDAAVVSCVLTIATAIPIWLTSREGERTHGPT
jgi:thiamine transport system permease protein